MPVASVTLIRGVSLLVAALTRPRWDPKEFARLQELYVQGIDKGLRESDDEALGKAALDLVRAEVLPEGKVAAVEALKNDDGPKVIAKMKDLPTNDPVFGKGRVRPDGRKIHPAYLVEVKKPTESKGPYDYYKIRATIPADQAFRPLKDGECPLVK